MRFQRHAIDVIITKVTKQLTTIRLLDITKQSLTGTFGNSTQSFTLSSVVSIKGDCYNKSNGKFLP